MQITGEAEFNEVFLDDVFVPDDCVIGAVNDGWRVSSSTLTHERGTNPRQLVIHAQHLEELLRLARRATARSTTTAPRSGWPRPTSRCGCSSCTTGGRSRGSSRARRSAPRARRSSSTGGDEQAAAPTRAGRARAGRAAVPRGADGNPGDGEWQRSWLYYQASSIFAGTNEIQRNIIGERVLGLPREPAPAAESVSGPLEGLRVLDLGTRIAAPFCAGLLGEQGAEVIKIEQPGTGDFMREIGPFVDGYSLFWAVEGRGRKSVTLDLRQPDGPGPASAGWPPTADVVCENFRPGTLERWGIGPGRPRPAAGVRAHLGLRPGRPVRRSGPGLDRLGIGYGGLLHLTGYPDRPPVRAGVTITDYLTGVFAAQAATAALYRRDAGPRRPAQGAVIDAALYGSVLRILEWTIAGYDRLGIVREREGNRLANSAPLDNYPTADGKYVCIVAGSDANFARLCAAMGRPELVDDPRFATPGRPGRALRRDQRHRRRVDGVAARGRGRGRVPSSTTCPSRPPTPPPTSSPTRTWPPAATSSPSTTRCSARSASRRRSPASSARTAAVPDRRAPPRRAHPRGAAPSSRRRPTPSSTSSPPTASSESDSASKWLPQQPEPTQNRVLQVNQRARQRSSMVSPSRKPKLR